MPFYLAIATCEEGRKSFLVHGSDLRTAEVRVYDYLDESGALVTSVSKLDAVQVVEALEDRSVDLDLARPVGD